MNEHALDYNMALPLVTDAVLTHAQTASITYNQRLSGSYVILSYILASVTRHLYSYFAWPGCKLFPIKRKREGSSSAP